MATHMSAGFPVDLGMTRNYDEAFRQMALANIRVLFPYSAQYMMYQLGEDEYLPWIEDAIPPKIYEPGNPLIAAAKFHGIKLMLNGELFYPQGVVFPSSANDPVALLISAHGRDVIHGIWGADEPAMNSTPTTYMLLMFNRTKLLGIPLTICQMPMVSDKPELFGTRTLRNAYLNKCVAHTAYCDEWAFDIYPIPAASCAIIPPQNATSGAAATTIQDAIGKYDLWMASKKPTKPRGMILQAHAIPDFYSDSVITDMGMTREELLGYYPEPTVAQLIEQRNAAGGARTVGWYGPSFQRTAQDADWTNLLLARASMD